MTEEKWLSYSDLAWTEPIVAPPEDFEEETNFLCRAIREHAGIDVKTLLHLGSGAGINDYTFKKHFDVTGVDLSRGMLEVAKSINPEVTYHHGDLRSIKLGKQFDSIAVPEALAYMLTRKDLQAAIANAHEHLKPGGVLLATAQLADQFQENDFVYKGSGEGVEITVFENNHIPVPGEEMYESTMIYLIRRDGKLEIHTDVHQLGLFDMKTWLTVLEGFDFTVKRLQTDHLYDRFIMGEGTFALANFVCRKGSP